MMVVAGAACAFAATADTRRAPPAARRPAPTRRRLSHVLSRMSTSLGTLTKLLAAEDYEQALHLPVDAAHRRLSEALTAPTPVPLRGTLPGAERTVTVRRLRPSFLFLRTPSDGAWIGFRDVTHVNGRRVDPGRRAELDVPGEPPPAMAAPERRGRAVQPRHDRSYVNAPTFALVVLQAENHARFSFASTREPRRRGTRCLLTFQEPARPTIVRGAGCSWWVGSLAARRDARSTRRRASSA